MSNWREGGKGVGGAREEIEVDSLELKLGK